MENKIEAMKFELKSMNQLIDQIKKYGYKHKIDMLEPKYEIVRMVEECSKIQKYILVGDRVKAIPSIGNMFIMIVMLDIQSKECLLKTTLEDHKINSIEAEEFSNMFDLSNYLLSTLCKFQLDNNNYLNLVFKGIRDKSELDNFKDKRDMSLCNLIFKLCELAYEENSNLQMCVQKAFEKLENLNADFITGLTLEGEIL